MILKVGDTVNYHSRIGGPITSSGHMVTNLGILPSGDLVAWISGKSGCVSVKALSLVASGEDARMIMEEAMHMLLYVDAHMNERKEVAEKLAKAIGHPWPPYPDAHDADDCPKGERGCDGCR